MFFDELKPLVQELVHEPTAFLGGFVAGLLRLNPDEDPLRSWLANQGVNSTSTERPTPPPPSGPQRISID